MQITYIIHTCLWNGNFASVDTGFGEMWKETESSTLPEETVLALIGLGKVLQKVHTRLKNEGRIPDIIKGKGQTSL